MVRSEMINRLAAWRPPLTTKPKRVSECLLGPGWPLFTADQRQWIAQLAERPLRLYDVTEVFSGQQMTLCDALDTEREPITVREKSGSDAFLVGTHIGARIMEVAGHHVLSRAVCLISRLAKPQVVASLREGLIERIQAPLQQPQESRHLWHGDSAVLMARGVLV
jgi:hypothetical protein